MKKSLLAIVGGIIGATTISKSRKSINNDLKNWQDLINKAKEQDKYIFIYFSGSDWCPWCKKFDQEFFNNKEFKERIRNNFIIYNADFPRYKKLNSNKTKLNNELKNKFKIRGFPLVILCDKNGDEIARTGYKRNNTLDQYIDHIENLIKK